MTIIQFKNLLTFRMWDRGVRWWPFNRPELELAESSSFRHDSEMETVVFMNKKGEHFIVTIEKIK